MEFKIVDVFTHDGQLVVTVEHYNPNGSFWFLEHYTFQGREWSKQKRATNALSQLLLDDGTVAPTNPGVGAGDPPQPFLPPGRTWALRPGPHMDDSSILDTIRSIHQRRLVSGWPQGSIDRLGPAKPSPQDTTGAPALAAHFQHLKGRVV
jgi:hypothetical protein